MGPGTGTPRAARLRAEAPGLLLAAGVAAAAVFLARHYGAPAMLMALLIGMALHGLATLPRPRPGVGRAAGDALRLGVGLLGARLQLETFDAVAPGALLALGALVPLTIAAGVLTARALRRDGAFGVLAGGAVAICGASAALAIAAVLPARPQGERDAALVVIGVTLMSTLAMVAYPVLFRALGLADGAIGFLIGATIHDVAQVVGAGYSVSEEAGVVAAFVKMLRVAMLPAVVIAVALAYGGGAGGRLRLPWFLWLFVALAAATLAGLVPEILRGVLATLSSALLVTAIAAIGLRTDLRDLMKVPGWQVLCLGVPTLALLALALGALALLG